MKRGRSHEDWKSLALNKRTTRRGFMKLGASAGISLAAVSAFAAW